MNVLTSSEQVTAAWLTAVLQREGALTAGTVQAVSLLTSGAYNSHIVHIAPRYSAKAAGKRPSRLLLKIVADEDNMFGPSEVHYYRRDYRHAPDAPLVASYDGVYDEAQQRYHILMDDHSDTHQGNLQETPTLAYGRAVAAALAALHAPYWEQVNTELSDVDRYVAHETAGLKTLLAHAAPDIPVDWSPQIRELVKRLPHAMRTRAASGAPMTLVHGDANPGNVLTHRQHVTPVYLLDRQPFRWSLTRWMGAADLAYVMGLKWWPPDLRRHWEAEVLAVYHAELQRHGVTNYTEAQLWRDYKLALACCLYVALAWCVDEEECQSMKWVWLDHLRHVMTAVHDLNIRQQLD